MSETIQTIARLTPLADVLALIEARVKPVPPRTLDIGASAGRVLAKAVTTIACPPAAIALGDGWAVNAAETLGAGSYTPALLLRTPPRVEVGQPMPAGTDSVAPLDAVKIDHGRAEVLVTVFPGEGVLPTGGDSDPAIALRQAGARLRLTDLAVLAAAGIARVTVREPRIRVMPLRTGTIVNAAARAIAADIERYGGAARLDENGGGLALAFAADGADAIVGLGGTGSGLRDISVQTLAREGELALHGLALTPGETAAFGFNGLRPVLILPGRLDAALSVWLTVGRAILARLADIANKEDEGTEILTLARKITSTVGLAELVPVRCRAGRAEPLASKYLPLSALTQADGWVLVPAESEGYSAGAGVQVRPWP